MSRHCRPKSTLFGCLFVTPLVDYKRTESPLYYPFAGTGFHPPVCGNQLPSPRGLHDSHHGWNGPCTHLCRPIWPRRAIFTTPGGRTMKRYLIAAALAVALVPAPARADWLFTPSLGLHSAPTQTAASTSRTAPRSAGWAKASSGGKRTCRLHRSSSKATMTTSISTAGRTS